MKRLMILALAALLLETIQVAEAQEAAPRSGQQQMTHDQLHIAVQEICPVSGEKLGEHGKPVKVKIGKEYIYLCCKGCLKQKVDPQHWATIHENFAKAQAKCPVMGRPLPEHAKWAIVEGQIVYVCCPPCITKLEADPKTYLPKIDELYAASLKAKAATN